MSMLKQSVLDAKMLHDAALKEAEKKVTQEHKKIIEEAVFKLLEQDLPDLDSELSDDSESEPLPPMSDIGGAEIEQPADVPGAPASYMDSDEDDTVTLNLTRLREMIEEELEQYDNDEILETLETHEEVASDISEQLNETDMSSGSVEGVPTSEEDTLFEEEEKRDCGCPMKESCMHEINQELEEEVKTLQEKVMLISKQNATFYEALKEAKKALKNQLFENKKLVLQNKLFMDESLSEPQRRSLVESINKAKTAEEADALYRVRSATGQQRPKSLQEGKFMNSMRSGASILSESKGKQEEEVDPAILRMQKLAGIVK